jgi:hypothetical protein
VEFKSDDAGLIVYTITAEGVRKRAHRKRRREGVRSQELSPT